MNFGFDDFPQTLQAIETGIARHLHTGVQVYVSVAGHPVLDAGAGRANDFADYDAATISLWRSAGKPVTAAAILRFLETSSFSTTTSLSELLSETAETCPGAITLQQILTHTSGLPIIETGWPRSAWTDILSRILAVEAVNPDAAYQPQATWFLLGEILRRYDADRRPFADFLLEDVLQPLTMHDSWCGLPDDVVARVRKRLPQYWTREKGQLSKSSFGDGDWVSQASPGGNLRGPVSSLGRFYEMLMRGGTTADGKSFLSGEAVRAMTKRHRVGMFDATLQHTVDFGLGVIIDSNHHGTDTVPYGFGRYCSSETFGHGGSQCAMGFCDPVRQLVVCWAANGFCGEGQHQRRNRAINEAIYGDLGYS